MIWSDHNTRMRRFLRDPDKNIWTDVELKRLFNIEQIEFQRDAGEIQDVTIVRMPPLFQETYLYDWEWGYTEHEQGYLNTCVSDRNYYDQAGIVYTQRWEPDIIANADGPVSDLGTFYIHPWEAWMIASGAPSDSPPVWVANKFMAAMFIAFNKEPLEGVTEKEAMSRDRTWRQRAGKSYYYWRNESLENFIHIYPLPVTVTWSDTTDENGMVLYGLDATATSNRGTIIDYTGAYASVNDGITTDVLEKDSNLIVVYKKLPRDIEAETDSSDFASYLTKYIEYGVLERAYSANTDGQIESLKDYWNYRKETSKKVLQLFNAKRTQDRDYVLKTQMTPPQRRQRHARLPDSYPAVH